MKTTLPQLRSILLLLCIFAFLPLSARWSQVLEYPCTWAVYASQDGPLYAANYVDDGTGGIQVSYDQGETWIKTSAPDFCYSKFIENDGDIYALGMSCMIAKSTDQGETWYMLDYSQAVEEYLPKGQAKYCAAYGAAFLGDRLYVADFYCGVVYTDDFDNWYMTDRESLTYQDDSDSFVENVYTLITYKDQLYAMGLYSIFRYDEPNNSWIFVRDSNCMAVCTIYNDLLVCGRAVTNDSLTADFLLWTDNCEQWQAIPRPEGMISNYVRALASDKQNIYVGMLDQGTYYTSDMGLSWHDFSYGLPVTKTGYANLISLTENEEYLYAAIFYDADNNLLSGIYRVKKSEMDDPGADDPNRPEHITISYNPESGSSLSELSGFDAIFNCDITTDAASGGYVFRDGIMQQTAISVTISDDRRTASFAIDPVQVAAGTYSFKYLDWLVKPVDATLGATPEINPTYIVEPAGIQDPMAPNSQHTLYNLQGIKLREKPSSGYIILDGRKIFIK